MGGRNHSKTLNSCWVSLNILRRYFNHLNNLMKSVTFGILFSDIKDLILTLPWSMSLSQCLKSETQKKNYVNSKKDKVGRFHETFLRGKGCLYNMCLIFILSITFVKINFKQVWIKAQKWNGHKFYICNQFACHLFTREMGCIGHTQEQKWYKLN